MMPTSSSQPPLVPPMGSAYNQPPSNIMYPTAPSSQAPPIAPPTEPALPSPGHIPPPGTDNMMAWNDPPMLKTKKVTQSYLIIHVFQYYYYSQHPLIRIRDKHQSLHQCRLRSATITSLLHSPLWLNTAKFDPLRPQLHPLMRM